MPPWPMPCPPRNAAFEADEQGALNRFSGRCASGEWRADRGGGQGEKVNLHLTGEGPMSRVTCEFDAASRRPSRVNNSTIEGILCRFHRFRCDPAALCAGGMNLNEQRTRPS